jgi:hypothetical protein
MPYHHRWLIRLVLSSSITLGEFRGLTAAASQFSATSVATTAIPPPPPPPPPKLPPIHYSFPEAASESLSTAAPRDDTPRWTASARQDVITRYIQESFWHRLSLSASASLVGTALSTALSFSLGGTGLSPPWGLGIAIVYALLIWVRQNIYAELLRAASMAALLSWQRWQRIRRRYPTGRYLYAAVVRGAPRRPFPDPNDDADFVLLPTCLAMAVLGAAAVPGNIPLLPTSLTRIVAAILVGYTTTLPTRSGDVCRCLGTRVRVWLSEWRRLARQVELPRHAGVVAAALFDRAMILDRQHRVRQRLATAVAQGVAAVRQRKRPTEGQEEELDEDDGRRRRRRRDREEEELDRDFRREDATVEESRRRRYNDDSQERTSR